ncbi:MULTISPECIES: glycosyltransferase [Actinosynnema]|uniref:glycosyltransferase n=1 Tax=Actinosynnema TaxID=40566 RepID=UPI0020A2DD37|nr:glycosyltransferase [Actinosynnema pretiosum]MCP2096387.1 UDP:flavonoid glycosyltransferase YjiC, YdhE family [Actinosynnema pretiosum]
MTRVLLSTYGTRGDVEPLLALAVELRALGAGVRVCAPPDEEFARRLAGLGIDAVPVGPPIRELMSGAVPPSAAELSRYRVELVDAQFSVLPAAAAGCDALVVAGLAQVAARSVAEDLGIRYAYVTYAAVNLPSPHHGPPPRPGWPEPEGDNTARWALDADLVDAQFREPLNRHRAALGLPPVAAVRDHVHSDRPWLAADPLLGPWPPGQYLEVVQTGAWTTADESPLPAELAEFLTAGPPPVYVGFGSIGPAPGVARAAFEAGRALGHRVLVSRGWADLDLVDGRDDCLAIGHVNHQRLFGELAAVVHHGGAGTTHAAAKAGVPQVVVPIQVADNPYWAGRVAACGVGAALDGRTATRETLAAALETALTRETRDRARALGAGIRTDGASRAARLLLDDLSAPAGCGQGPT